MKTSTIAIVGGGAAGVSVFAQLIEKLIASNRKDVAILLIEKDARVGPGLPYGTTSHESILNMRYQKMSIIPENPDSVSEWLHKNKERWVITYPNFDPENDAYPPRSLYGLYLQDVFQENLKRAVDFGIECIVIKGCVLSIDSDSEKIRLKTDSGKVFEADKAILALGNYASTTYTELKNKSGYFKSFWPDEATLPSIPNDGTICVLGTRLTAIDAALTLLADSRRKVILASRGGLLPKVQAVLTNGTHRQALLNKVEQLSKKGSMSLKNLAEIIKEEIEGACNTKLDWDSVLCPKGSVTKILERDIESAKNNTFSCWQSVLASTSDIIEIFWQKLPNEDKREFLEKYGSIWFVYRHAMPLKNAEKILSYLKEARLEVRSGIRSVVFDDQEGKFNIEFQEGETLKVPFVINATEAGLDITKLDSPLIKNLLDADLIAPHPFGGIDVDFDTCKIIDKDGKASNHLYSIGYLTRGVHFYTNDVARIAEYARRVVSSLLK